MRLSSQLTVSAALFVLASLCGCERSREPAVKTTPAPTPAAKAAKQASDQAKPPPLFEPFVAPEPWKPRRGKAAEVPPPDLDAETWRALVNQYKPHQKKTPKWQPLPARKAVELQMPPGNGYRCAVGPLRVSTAEDDFGTELKGWVLARPLLCSSDDFASWTEYGLRERLLPDGTRETRFSTDAQLRERAGDKVKHTRVLIRSGEVDRKATTGPPKILAGVEVDDD